MVTLGKLGKYSKVYLHSCLMDEGMLIVDLCSVIVLYREYCCARVTTSLENVGACEGRVLWRPEV